MKKKIFIGSSTEALEKAKKVKKALLDIGADVTLWSDYSVFIAARIPLDDLIRATQEHDGAVFIFDKDDLITKRKKVEGTISESTEYIPRDNVIAEAGMFIATLGRQAVALCTTPGVTKISDFEGITTIHFDKNLEKRLSAWFEEIKKRHTMAGENNVLMRSREKIHQRYSIDSRFHVTDEGYKSISDIRIMNLASTIIINPQYADSGHFHSGDVNSLSEVMKKIMSETEANIKFILTQPNKYNLEDIKTKIANERSGSREGTLAAALKELYQQVSKHTSVYQERFPYQERFSLKPILFHLYLMKTSMPFGILNVEFKDEFRKYNHVKVDLYSAALSNESKRRSFVIWQEDDPENYDFFVGNFEQIISNNNLVEKIENISQLKKWIDVLDKK